MMNKKHIGSLTLAVLAASLITAPVRAQSPAAGAATEVSVTANFPSHKDAVSYAIGVTTARNLLKDGVEIDPAIVLKGMNDVIAGQRTLLTDTEIKSLMNNLVADMRQKFIATRREVEDGNRKKGDAFRVAFAKEAGVQHLPDGVLYKIAKAGTGATPLDTDSVVVHYKGTLVDGKEFDATAEGKPATLKIEQLIPGWKEVLRMMPVGSRWKIVIPSDLAYGARGAGSDVGPNETLVFDVELVAIAK